VHSAACAAGPRGQRAAPRTATLLKVLNADFITSAATADGIPRDGLPRIAMAGRSNVGKSSLINALCRSRIARTSAAPGKTRLANFYRVLVEGGPGGPGRWGLYLVDLPGYGYARGGAESAAELALVAESYFRATVARQGVTPGTTPRSVRREVGEQQGADSDDARSPGARPPAFLLLDSRHPGLRADLDAAGWLAEVGAAVTLVATKVDKLTRAERNKNLKTIDSMFGLPALPVSAESGEGMDELWRTIARLARDVQ
jgi:GTP-binding protein